MSLSPEELQAMKSQFMVEDWQPITEDVQTYLEYNEILAGSLSFLRSLVTGSSKRKFFEHIDEQGVSTRAIVSSDRVFFGTQSLLKTIGRKAMYSTTRLAMTRQVTSASESNELHCSDFYFKIGGKAPQLYVCSTTVDLSPGSSLEQSSPPPPQIMPSFVMGNRRVVDVWAYKKYERLEFDGWNNPDVLDDAPLFAEALDTLQRSTMYTPCYQVRFADEVLG